MPEKIQRVNEDDVTLHYNNNWYAILYTDLVAIEEAQNRYGLIPSEELFAPLGMTTPYSPQLENGQYSDEVVYPPNPTMTDELALEMRVRLFKRRIQSINTEIFDDLRALFNQYPSQFNTLLQDSLIP